MNENEKKSLTDGELLEIAEALVEKYGEALKELA